jgi:hypothetical protein
MPGLVHTRSVQKMSEQIPCGFRHLEIDQCAVAIKPHLFRPEAPHVPWLLSVWLNEAEYSGAHLAEFAAIDGHSAEAFRSTAKPSTTFRRPVGGQLGSIGRVIRRSDESRSVQH